MWTGLVWLMMSSSAARVVDFPDPVGPVTSTRPRGRSAKRADHRGQVQSLELGDVERNRAQHRPDRSTLAEHVHPEPALAGDRVARVELELADERGDLALVQDREHEPLDHVAVEDAVPLDRLQDAVDPHGRSRARRRGEGRTRPVAGTARAARRCAAGSSRVEAGTSGGGGSTSDAVGMADPIRSGNDTGHLRERGGPKATLASPSLRRSIIPWSVATRRMSSDEARATTRLSSSSDISITSWIAIRPR